MHEQQSTYVRAPAGEPEPGEDLRADHESRGCFEKLVVLGQPDATQRGLVAAHSGGAFSEAKVVPNLLRVPSTWCIMLAFLPNDRLIAMFWQIGSYKS